MRKVGVVLVGLGLLGAVVGHYVAYNADPWADTAGLGIGGAIAAICVVIVGLMLIQSRS